MIEIITSEHDKLESAIIGSILMDRNTYDIAFTNLVPEDFTLNDNVVIFNSFMRLYLDGRPIDLLTVKNDLERNNETECLNQMLYALNVVGSTANFEYHVLILKQKAAKRNLTALGMDIMRLNSDDSINVVDSINNALESIYSIQNRIVSKKTKTFKENYIETVESALKNNGNDQLGLFTGFSKFDSIFLGYTAPDLTIIAAGPGEGKSTFALNQAKYISLSGHDVLYFSLEMKEKQLIWKMMSDEFNMQVVDIRLGRFKSDEAIKSNLAMAKLHIYDKGGLTIDDFVGIVKMEHKAKNIKIVFIDYIQLMRLGTYQRKVSSKNDELTIISNKLKQLAMELEIPIVMLSQLNRDKHRKRYGLSDLRDSGALEQDADNVVFIFRPYEHQMDSYNLGGKEIDCDENAAIINVEKNRLGKTGEFEMIFNGAFSRFEDLERNQYVVDPMKSIRLKDDDLPF